MQAFATHGHGKRKSSRLPIQRWPCFESDTYDTLLNFKNPRAALLLQPKLQKNTSKNINHIHFSPYNLTTKRDTRKAGKLLTQIINITCTDSGGTAIVSAQCP